MQRILSIFLIFISFQALSRDKNIEEIDSMNDLRAYANAFNSLYSSQEDCLNTGGFKDQSERSIAQTYCSFWSFVSENLTSNDSVLSRVLSNHETCTSRNEIQLSNDASSISNRLQDNRVQPMESLSNPFRRSYSITTACTIASNTNAFNTRENEERSTEPKDEIEDNNPPSNSSPVRTQSPAEMR